MSQSGAIIGKGTTIAYSATAEGTFTPLAEVFKVTPPTIKVGDVDVTHYGTDGDIKETISAGFKDVGTIDIEVNYLKAERATLLGLVGAKQFWKLTYPDGAVESFTGYINELGGEIPLEDKITQKIVVKLNSDITFTPGT